jgi:hypothetical protein
VAAQLGNKNDLDGAVGVNEMIKALYVPASPRISPVLVTAAR